ncbi:MAG: hypothetical protein ABIS36_02695 [Chryseolinea sp.]
MKQLIIATTVFNNGIQRENVDQVPYDDKQPLRSYIKAFQDHTNELFHTDNAKVKAMAITTHDKKGNYICDEHGNWQLVTIYETP